MESCSQRTNANRRDHSYSTTLPFNFVIFKVCNSCQSSMSKHELLLGTSSAKSRSHFNSSPCASHGISFAAPGTGLSQRFTFKLENALQAKKSNFLEWDSPPPTSGICNENVSIWACHLRLPLQSVERNKLFKVKFIWPILNVYMRRNQVSEVPASFH